MGHSVLSGNSTLLLSDLSDLSCVPKPPFDQIFSAAVKLKRATADLGWRVGARLERSPESNLTKHFIGSHVTDEMVPQIVKSKDYVPSFIFSCKNYLSDINFRRHQLS